MGWSSDPLCYCAVAVFAAPDSQSSKNLGQRVICEIGRRAFCERDVMSWGVLLRVRTQIGSFGLHWRLGLPVAAVFSTAFTVTPISQGWAGQLDIAPSLEARQTFSDNIDLETDEEKQSALISEVVPGLSVRSTGARLTGALDAFPILRYQSAGDAEGYDLAGDLAGFATLEAVERILFVDAQASVSQQVLDNRDVASTGNENDVITYRISPYLRHRFGGAAQGEARYLLSQVTIRGAEDNVGNVAASDTTTQSLRLSLESPNLSTRLKWSVFGLVLEEDRSDDDDVSRREVAGEAEYAFSRAIGVIFGAGYQQFEDGVAANEVDDPTWKVGVRLTPGPRTEFRATAGERDGDPNFAADFEYKFSSRTILRANFSRVLETSQERLDRTLSNIDVGDETDDLIDQDTDLAFNPDPSPFSIDDQTTRTDTLRVGLNGVRGRNAFSINASWSEQEVRPTGTTDTIIPVSASFTRRLSPRSTLDLTLAYERSDFDDGQLDNEYSAAAGLTYRLSETVEAESSYSFRLQDSNVATSEFEEHRILFALRKSF